MGVVIIPTPALGSYIPAQQLTVAPDMIAASEMAGVSLAHLRPSQQLSHLAHFRFAMKSDVRAE